MAYQNIVHVEEVSFDPLDGESQEIFFTVDTQTGYSFVGPLVVLVVDPADESVLGRGSVVWDILNDGKQLVFQATPYTRPNVTGIGDDEVDGTYVLWDVKYVIKTGAVSDT